MNLLGAVSHTVRAGRAGRGYGVVDALDPKGYGQGGGVRVRHDPRHHERTNPLGPFFLGDGIGEAHVLGRGAARTHDQPGTLVGDLAVFQAGVSDRLLHGDIVERRAVAHEPAQLAIQCRIDVELDRAMHVAAEPEFGVFLRALDSASAGLERARPFPACR